MRHLWRRACWLELSSSASLRNTRGHMVGLASLKKLPQLSLSSGKGHLYRCSAYKSNHLNAFT